MRKQSRYIQTIIGNRKRRQLFLYHGRRALLYIVIFTYVIELFLHHQLVLNENENNNENNSSNNNNNFFNDGPTTKFLSTSSDFPQNQHKQQRLLLFITTIFSESHQEYFKCCWPELMEKSKLLPYMDVFIFSNNVTEIPSSAIDTVKTLFQHNPSFQIYFCDPNEAKADFQNMIETHDQLQYQNDASRFKDIQFQHGASLGLKMGFGSRKGWFSEYDWMIRINPDVLIRNSDFLRETMGITTTTMTSGALTSLTSSTTALSPHDNDGDGDDNTNNNNNKTVVGIFVKCNDLQLHTDFFAVRPDAAPADAFQSMARMREGRGKDRRFTVVNHELTASKVFLHPNNLKNKDMIVKFLPNTDRSRGKCRVRGINTPVYHGHEGCDKDTGMCTALRDWEMAGHEIT